VPCFLTHSVDFETAVGLIIVLRRHRTRKFGEITQNKGHYANSRSFKVTDFGTNRKLMYDFLLEVNTNLLPVLHRFRDIAFDTPKIAIFGYPSCV